MVLVAHANSAVFLSLSSSMDMVLGVCHKKAPVEGVIIVPIVLQNELDSAHLTNPKIPLKY